MADQPRSLAMGITATDMLTCAAAHDAHAQQAPKRQQKRRSVQQSVSKVSVVPPACRGWPGGGVVSTVYSAPNRTAVVVASAGKANMPIREQVVCGVINTVYTVCSAGAFE